MLATNFVSKIKPYCEYVKICGGLRRGKETVHDIDIVILPSDLFSISAIIGTYREGKSTHNKFTLNIGDIPVEIWIAYDEIQYEVMKLVRTGSAGFNQHLAMMAHSSNMVLRYTKGLYGLYAAVYNKVVGPDNRGKNKWIINPLRRLHWKENEMIEAVFGYESKFVDPHNRNVEFQIYTRAEEDTSWQ